MKKLMILFILGSCATTKPSLNLEEGGKSLPAWVYSPYDLCSEQAELCATGEGRTFKESDLSSLTNLGSIFEVQVTSQLNSFSSSQQANPWQASASEEVNQSLTQSVNQILQSVQVKKRFKKDGVSYSLASLDKGMSVSLLTEKMIKLDAEISELWKKKQRTSYKKLYTLTLERERLNEKYAIVSGAPLISPVSHQQLLEWRSTKPSLENLSFHIGQAPDWLTDKLKDLFSEAGFVVGDKNSDKVLEVNMTSIKEYLNVQGFEKYTFTLNLTSIFKGNKQKDLSISETVTGRSQQDALLKAKSFFNDYIENHLSELNFD